MEQSDRPLACLCGYEHFERVVVERPPRAPVVTDFLACVGCAAMYFVPVSRAVLDRSRHEEDMVAIRDAAKDYVKPGRHTPPRRRRK